jgi:hypothetical protein
VKEPDHFLRSLNNGMNPQPLGREPSQRPHDLRWMSDSDTDSDEDFLLNGPGLAVPAPLTAEQQREAIQAALSSALEESAIAVARSTKAHGTARNKGNTASPTKSDSGPSGGKGGGEASGGNQRGGDIGRSEQGSST